MKKIKPKDRVQVFLKDGDAEYMGNLIHFTKYGVEMCNNHNNCCNDVVPPAAAFMW